MISRYRAKFRSLITLQVLLLNATIFILSYCVLATDLLAVPLIIGGILVFQIIGLLKYVESHVETLEEFFLAINYEDFTRRFVEDDLDVELKNAFNRILAKFQHARAEKDLQANYLDMVVRHVPIPLIAVRSDGSLSLVNNPLRRLTGIATLRHLDQLTMLDPSLPHLMRAIEPEHPQLLQTTIRDMPMELRVSVSEIWLQGQKERLYSIENISGELTARETSAWRNLIRVLTHEIMNTMTPVTSLAHSCNALIEHTDASTDIRDAMSTIARRSERLMEFVSRYRELLQLPQPNLQRFSVLEACQGTVILVRDELEDITLNVEITPESLELEADQSLLDQVLLNLIRNAADALRDINNAQIWLCARLSYGRILITVRDNGPGIPDDVIDQVFIPFFTTKRDGSGIGLSLSRQIINSHDGEIAVSSDSSGTTVSILF